MANISLPDSNGGKSVKDTTLSDAQKASIRKKLVQFTTNLMDIPYEYGAEWISNMMVPKSLDCSELIEGVYRFFGMKMPDGSQAQFDFTIPVSHPGTADLAFFGKGGKTTKIYHVGMVFNDYHIIEARGLQPGASFETGKVILRPRTKWEAYKNFVGYRTHPKLV